MKIINKASLTQQEEDDLLHLQVAIFPQSPWSKDYLHNFFAEKTFNPLASLLYDKDKLVGFALGHSHSDTREYCLSLAAISSNYRGKNLGKKLVKNFLLKAFDEFSIEKVILHYRESKNLQGFYEKIGFKNDHTEGAYKNGEPKHYMEITRDDIMN